MYLDIHAIQSLPPSNLNRDESGSPKTALIGGARRARVSSQSWKKAIRDYYKERYSNSGVRTKNIGALVVEELQILGLDEKAATERAKQALLEAGISSKKEPMATSALFATSKPQVRLFAEAALNGASKKDLQRALKERNSLDLALFGRMVADDANLNVEAASQFAHAFSTHAVDPEFDFFTAVDENSLVDHAGAGMVGEIEYNSATLYRFATIDLQALAKNLMVDPEELAIEVTRFVESFVHAVPSGKQNTFAARTHPDFLMVSLRDDYPVSFAPAFEAPVRSASGYSAASQQSLLEYARGFNEAYASTAISFIVRLGAKSPDVDDLAQELSLPQVLEAVRQRVLENSGS